VRSTVSVGGGRSPWSFGMRHGACILAVFLAICSNGCRKPPADVLARAQASTNVTFQTYSGESIVLPEASATRVKQMVKCFSDPSRVELRNEILPAFSGHLVLQDVSFGWIGSLLCLKDPGAERWYVIEEAALGRMTEAYFKAKGPPPMGELSRAQWGRVLATLEDTK